jgi:hypothetical protein
MPNSIKLAGQPNKGGETMKKQKTFSMWMYKTTEGRYSLSRTLDDTTAEIGRGELPILMRCRLSAHRNKLWVSFGSGKWNKMEVDGVHI